jgi:hypothetical protein
MTARLILFSFAAFGVVLTAPALKADQVELQNGDRLSGKVLSVTADTVVLQSDVLGKVNVPRQKIATLAFGTNAAPVKAAMTSARMSLPAAPPTGSSLIALLNTNAELFAATGGPGTDTNLVRQIREQMLAGNPAAAAKFDEIADGLMSGKLNLNDLRREAKASADQLRELERQNPEAAASLDGYLQVLDNFLNEPADAPAVVSPPSQQSSRSP